MSYGCGPNSTCAQINGSGCSLGWPSYAIDHHDHTGTPSGLVNRAMEWASYLYNVDGELYYAVGENFKMVDACWGTANCAYGVTVLSISSCLMKSNESSVLTVVEQSIRCCVVHVLGRRE
jgi:hypothetical protein